MTRGIPVLFEVVGPFVTSVPRESFTVTLETTGRRWRGADRHGHALRSLAIILE